MIRAASADNRRRLSVWSLGSGFIGALTIFLVLNAVVAKTWDTPPDMDIAFVLGSAIVVMVLVTAVLVGRKLGFGGLRFAGWTAVSLVAWTVVLFATFAAVL
jgi:hypothetical protein